MVKHFFSRIAIFTAGKPLLVLALILLIHLIFHLRAMQLPACGNHVWRQCNTLALADNFYQEEMNIMKPRVDKRFDTPGITGSEFPLYSYVLAGGYKVFGKTETLHRWLSWLIFAIALLGLYSLARQYGFSVNLALVSAFVFAFIPEVYFHSINAVPDMLALAFTLWAWFAARKWLLGNDLKWLLFSMVFFSLGGMVKMQFLMPLFAICIEFWLMRAGFGYKKWIGILSLGLVSSVFTLGWYAYASYLTRLYGLHEFVHAMRHAENVVQSFEILGRTLLKDIPETLLGYGFLVFLIPGVVKAFQKRTQFAGLWIFVAVFVLFYFLIQYQFIHHGYYYLAITPLLSMAVAVGIKQVYQSKYVAMLILAAAAPIWSYARIDVANWQGKGMRIPDEFLSDSFLTEAQKLSAQSNDWIVGPDVSGCVYFYFTRSKGYPWYDTANGVENELLRYSKYKAGGVITNEPAIFENAIKGKVKYKVIGKSGSFVWYRFER